MTERAPEQNESMEDILQSIRRIIANEPGDEAAGHEGEEVLELTEIVGEPAPVPEPAPQPEPAPAPVVAAAPPPPPAPAPEPEPEPELARPPEMELEPVSTAPAAEPNLESLISEQAASASAHALQHLMDAMPKPKIDSPSFRSGSTLEGLVVESIKPMLKDWLDKNLPTLVQSLVEKEIRKLIPKD